MSAWHESAIADDPCDPQLTLTPTEADLLAIRLAIAHLTYEHPAGEWAVTEGRSMRIVLCGYDDEHEALASEGWTVIDGKSGRGAGYSTRPDNGRRERLWLSPTCITDGVQDRLDFGAVS